MKKILIMLSLSLVTGLPLIALIVKCSEDKKESLEIAQTKTVLAETITKDLAMIDFYVMYKGSFPEYSDYAIKSIVRQIMFKKNVLEVLKQNNVEFIEDTLEYIITPIDSSFRVLSIETKYYLRPEVQELWDEYVNARIEAYKVEEKARNLKILYGE